LRIGVTSSFLAILPFYIEATKSASIFSVHPAFIREIRVPFLPNMELTSLFQPGTALFNPLPAGFAYQRFRETVARTAG
jgi:hypothetical protein